MLVIISDLHLGDGTSEKPIEPSAFRLFESRLTELAYNASWRADGKYRPLRKINILWLGDILDPIHTTAWLDTKYGEDDYTRPWTDVSAPNFVKKLKEITHAILKNNRHAVDAIYNITKNKAIMLPPAIGDGQPNPTAKERIAVQANIYYMVGNHDWVYRLPGKGFDEIRHEIIESFGLANDIGPFPHTLEEAPELAALLAEYSVYARHGDIFSSFTYDKEKGRNASSAGDLFSIEVASRFPLEVQRQLKDSIPKWVFQNLRYTSNVRPLIAVPIWTINQITSEDLSASEQNKIRKIWNEVFEDFLTLQKEYYPFKIAAVRNLVQIIFLLFKNLSASVYMDLTLWAYRNFWQNDEYTLVKYALKEEAFLDEKANYIVYGHIHDYEMVPLDLDNTSSDTNRIYFNSGTWRAHNVLARNQLNAKHFVPYDVITYLTFYKDDQREGRHFETWSGASQ